MLRVSQRKSHAGRLSDREACFVPGATVNQSGGDPIEGMLKLEEMADSVTLRLWIQLIIRCQFDGIRSSDGGEVPFTWNGGNFQGEAAAAGEYIFLAEMRRGETVRQVPVHSEARVRAFRGMTKPVKY